jgi:NAD-dependent SIR2 family protein deacetylase
MSRETSLSSDQQIQLAASAIREADAIVVMSGAGMGVDSGLPDFRGNTGFWNAYPPFRKLGLSFYDLANPIWFRDNPKQAWGFYGHRMKLYRETEPNEGFDILLEWAKAKPAGYFVYTSNVDGHFQSKGFDAERVVECHGSFSFLQCRKPCTDELWSSSETVIDVNESTMLAREPLPRCKNCGAITRPNILMFNDWNWVEAYHAARRDKFAQWWKTISSDQKVAVVEIGAGTAVPSVRNEAENKSANANCTLVRINPRESEGPEGCISIAAGGLATLQKIAKVI